MDERRQMEDALRESEMNTDEAKKVVLNYERARLEDERVHEAEMRDYKVCTYLLVYFFWYLYFVTGNDRGRIGWGT